jgi:hypothetical protein
LFLERYRGWLTPLANSKDARIIVGAETVLQSGEFSHFESGKALNSTLRDLSIRRDRHLKPHRNLKFVDAGESDYSRVLKTGNLLISRGAKNTKNGKIAPNWNVSGTRLAKKRSGAAAEW